MKKILIWVLSLGLLLLLAGCEKTIKGSGVQTTEMRSLDTVDTVELKGNYQVNITSGQPQQLSLSGDNNILPYITTQIKGKKLIINTKKGVRLQPTQTPIVNVSLSNIKDLQKIVVKGKGVINAGGLNGDVDIRIDGVGTVMANNIVTDNLAVKINGAGSANLAGTTNEVDIKIDGSGQIVAKDLIARDADVKLNGTGELQVYASQNLAVKVNGDGKIFYYGEPRNVNQKISGNGEVLGIANNAQKNPS